MKLEHVKHVYYANIKPKLCHVVQFRYSEVVITHDFESCIRGSNPRIGMVLVYSFSHCCIVWVFALISHQKKPNRRGFHSKREPMTRLAFCCRCTTGLCCSSRLRSCANSNSKMSLRVESSPFSPRLHHDMPHFSSHQWRSISKHLSLSFCQRATAPVIRFGVSVRGIGHR